MDTNAVVQHISNWLKNYANKAKIDGFVVGVSGGIDSAVTSTLCAKTGLKVLCLEMPIHQADSHVSRAQEHIRFLQKNYSNVSSKCVNLTPVFESLKSEIDATKDQKIVDMALANTRARLRMTTLYYYAGLYGFIVAGTGNKVEDFGVGFYTKYGDGGVDLSPIADLLKTEVFAVAKHLEIIKPIQEAAPTDGLWGDDRTDEDQLGATYPELEWAMGVYEKGAVENDLSQHQKKVLRIYTQLHRQNQHKMNPIPVCKVPKEFL